MRELILKRTSLSFLLIILGFNLLAQEFQVPSNFQLPENADDQFNLLQGTLQPTILGITETEESGFTLLETDEGSLSFGRVGGTNVLSFSDGTDTYTSTASNVRFTPGLTTQFLSGENLSFTSSTSDRVTTADDFTFNGSRNDFELGFNDVDSISYRSYGADTLNLQYNNDNWSGNATDVYVRDSNGDFVEIGTADFNEERKTLRLTSVAGSQDGKSLSAGAINLMRDGDTDRAQAVDLFISDGSGDFLQAGTANLAISDDRNTFNLTNVSGATSGYDFTADSVTGVDTGDNITASALNIYVKDKDGNFVNAGTANYNDNTKTINLTDASGQFDGYDFNADRFNIVQDGDTDRVRAVDIYVGKGPNEFVQAGTANLTLGPTKDTLALTDVEGNFDGYDFTASSANLVDEDGFISGNGRDVYVQDENGAFVRIGSATFDEKSKTLDMTNLAGEFEEGNFSFDELGLYENDFGQGGSAVGLFIKGDDLGFIRAGEADFFLGNDKDTFNLRNFNGEAEGFTFRGDSLSGTRQENLTTLNITNFNASDPETTLSFGQGFVRSTDERTDTDFYDFNVKNGDLSFSTDRLQAGSDGDSLDLKTVGTLTTGGTDLNLEADFKGMSGIINSGPGEDGKILIQEDASGKLIKASGTVGVKTTEDGGIRKLGVSLGDDVYFKAVDADGNAKELTATFHYDEEKGQFYLKTVFKGGDQTEIKVFPFKFTSEKVGDDAVAALSVQIEKQNMQYYLRTMTNILDMEKINDYLSVGSSGQMQVRVGGDKGMEFYFANDNWSVGEDSNPHLGGPLDDGIALGLGFFNRGSDRSTTHSGGVLISSDSSLRYEVEAGTLSFGGMDLPDTGRIPLTLGTYYKYENDNGTAVFGTVGTSLADLGSVSGGVVVQNEIGENTTISYGGAVNSDGDYSVMAQFQWKFGGGSSNSTRLNNGNRYQSNYSIDAVREARDSVYRGAVFK